MADYLGAGLAGSTALDLGARHKLGAMTVARSAGRPAGRRRLRVSPSGHTIDGRGRARVLRLMLSPWRGRGSPGAPTNRPRLRHFGYFFAASLAADTAAPPASLAASAAFFAPWST